MKYLFFDLEYASSRGGIDRNCEFGYVVTDEKFNVIDRGNLIINPNLDRSEWDYRVVRKILTRPIKEYESNQTFPYHYNIIKNLISSADYILGHSVNGDAKAINDDCKRYDLPSIVYEFYDIKLMYKEFSNTRKDTSVENILKALNIEEAGKSHDAEIDAYHTMLELKSMLDDLGVTLEEMLELCPNSKDETSNFVVKSIEEARIRKEEEFKKSLNGDGSNDIRKHGDNRVRFLQFLDNVKPNKEGSNKFKDKKISISINYEEHHFRQMLNLIQLIVNEGGSLILKASLSNIFVKYDIIFEDGTLRNDSKYNYVCEANQNGADIEIIEFNELLDRLGISEEELDSMLMPSFDFLFEEGAVIKDTKTKNYIERKKNKDNKNSYSANESSGTKLGDILKAKGIDLDKWLDDKHE